MNVVFLLSLNHWVYNPLQKTIYPNSRNIGAVCNPFKKKERMMLNMAMMLQPLIMVGSRGTVHQILTLDSKKPWKNPIGPSLVHRHMTCSPYMWLCIYKYISGQILIFHQPRFPWNKGISLTKPPFGVRSCEVAIIWSDIYIYIQLLCYCKYIYIYIHFPN